MSKPHKIQEIKNMVSITAVKAEMTGERSGMEMMNNWAIKRKKILQQT